MEISIIIVSYNVRVFLEHCLTSVGKALDGITAEILVVDNASDDGSVEMVREKFPFVTIIANADNAGFGAANNQAAAIAKGDILFFLNPDTLVQEDTFRTLLQFFAKNSTAGLAGCKVLNPDGTLQPACRRSFPTPWVAFTKIVGLSSLFPNLPLFSKYNLTYRSPEATYEVDAVSGSCMAVRSDIFRSIGGFDEEFFMYGEDLDLCFRVKNTGYKVYYVHTTQIIHYKGESVKRSNIDEVRVFYEAMHVFVKKHFRYGFFSHSLLTIGIASREMIARISKHSILLGSMALDYFLVLVSWCVAEWLRFGEVFHFPRGAYSALFTVPPFVVVTTLLMFDVYTSRRHSISQTVGGGIAAFVILSAMTFFFKDYAFSRFVLFIAGIVSTALLVFWRELFRTKEQSGMFARRTLVVGVPEHSEKLLQKLKSKNGQGYTIVGFIHKDKKSIGETIGGVEILGSLESIGKIIQQYSVSDVIFSSDMFSYSEILGVIGDSSDKNVNFRLVPGSLDVIIGKTHIDDLNELPLVEIEYNANRLSNRVMKRIGDVVLGFILLAVAYPFASVRRAGGNRGRFTLSFSNLPYVLSGKMSLVGFETAQNGAKRTKNRFFVKPGLTGLAQVNNFDKLSEEEIAEYNMYYAKNQSFLLDLEILLKTLAQFVKE